LSERFAVNREFHLITTRKDEGAGRGWAAVVIAVADNFCATAEAEIPNPAVHAALSAELRLGSKPARGDWKICGNGGGYRFAAEVADEFSLQVEDVESEFLHVVRQVVIDIGAVSGIFGLWFVGWDGGAREGIVSDTDGAGGVEQLYGFAGLQRDFAERGNVVDHPEGAAVGADDEIVFVYDEIADGRDRQVELEGLPVIAVIEGNVDAEFGSRVEEALAFRIFSYAV
jgi:hypothetical protein